MDEKFYKAFDGLYCPFCYSCKLRDAGKNQDGKQIIKCEDCGASFFEEDCGLEEEEKEVE